MTCEQFEPHISDYLAGCLDEAELAEFDLHQNQCAACRQAAETARQVWSLLGALEPERPRPALRARFYQSLAAYQQGLSQPAPWGAGRLDQLRAWWSRQPVFQVAYSLLLLAAGVLAGHALGSRQSGPPEIAAMQLEIASMRQMVTLSLLQQQSASERLRGVDWSQQADRSDTQVLSALLYAVNHDPNVNVRLAAVDALRRFTGNVQVRTGIDESLRKQDSPLMQIALIDLIVEMRDRQSAPVLQALAGSAKANPEVRARADWGLARLR